SAGLEYPSESDAPFETFCWPAKPGDSARAQVTAHGPPAAKIEEMSVDEFFKPLDASDDAERFRQLQHTLVSRLTDVRVFRVGDICVIIYLIGKMPSGAWGGLQTSSVET